MKPWVIKGCVSVLAAIAVGGVTTVAAAEPAKNVWMMGELHDNPDAHFFRLKDLTKALGETWRPALIMEQFDSDRQNDLTQAWQTCKNAQCVITMAGSDDAQWQWDLYKPLLNLALEYRLPLVAGNLSRKQLQAVMKNGYSAVFDQQTISRFKLNNPLPAVLLTGQRQAIDRGHCNTLSASAIDDMVKAQVARDVNFARLIEQFASQGVVLIAGNGHVRRDIGVLQWLPPQIASKVVVSGYVEPQGADAALYDVMRLVEPHKRPDPCESLKSTPRAQ